MLQTEEVTPLIHQAIPKLDSIPFRLPIDASSNHTAYAAAGALLNSVGNMLKQTQPHTQLSGLQPEEARNDGQGTGVTQPQPAHDPAPAR